MNLKCQKTHDRLVHFLNGELPPSEYTFWENHLSGCTICQIEYEQLNETMVALRSLPQPEPPADLALKIRRRLEEQQHTAQTPRFDFTSLLKSKQNMPLFDLITLIFSKITDALKLGPRPVHINYAALFCYLTLAIFLIKLTFLTGSGPTTQTVAPNQSNNYVIVSPASKNRFNRNEITWAQVKMAGLRTSPDLSNRNKEFSERPPILRPIGSQVLHGGSWHEFK